MPRKLNRCMVFLNKNDKVFFCVRVLQIFESVFYKFLSPRFTNFESAFYKFLVRVLQILSPRFTNFGSAFYKFLVSVLQIYTRPFFYIYLFRLVASKFNFRPLTDITRGRSISHRNKQK